MEVGGNSNATAYLKKLGKESFEGYKNDFSKKYDLLLSKKVAEKLRDEPAPLVEEEPEHPAPKKPTEKPQPAASLQESMPEEEAPEPKPAEQGGFKAKKFAVTFNPKYAALTQSRRRPKEQEEADGRENRRGHRLQQALPGRQHHERAGPSLRPAAHEERPLRRDSRPALLRSAGARTGQHPGRARRGFC